MKLPPQQCGQFEARLETKLEGAGALLLESSPELAVLEHNITRLRGHAVLTLIFIHIIIHNKLKDNLHAQFIRSSK